MNEVAVPPTIFKNLVDFETNKSEPEQLFNRISPSDLNDYLQQFMPDLTAKVFRTYNASITLEKQLAMISEEESRSQETLMKFYNEANRKVAILCNHQKAAGKSHDVAMDRIQEQGEKLTERISTLKRHRDELKSGGPGVAFDEDDASTHKLPEKVALCEKELIRLKQRIEKMVHQAELREGNKNVSLTTSKINYMDPRITIAFCKRTGLEVGRVFSKTIIAKFPWALDVSEEYLFHDPSKISPKLAAQMAHRGFANGVQQFGGSSSSGANGHGRPSGMQPMDLGEAVSPKSPPLRPSDHSHKRTGSPPGSPGLAPKRQKLEE